MLKVMTLFSCLLMLSLSCCVYVHTCTMISKALNGVFRKWCEHFMFLVLSGMHWKLMKWKGHQQDCRYSFIDHIRWQLHWTAVWHQLTSFSIVPTQWNVFISYQLWYQRNNFVVILNIMLLCIHEMRISFFIFHVFVWMNLEIEMKAVMEHWQFLIDDYSEIADF